MDTNLCCIKNVIVILFVFPVSVPFTRDFDSIKTKLPQLEEGDKTCIETALLGVNQLVLFEWGYQTPVQIILVTTDLFLNRLNLGLHILEK